MKPAIVQASSPSRWASMNGEPRPRVIDSIWELRAVTCRSLDRSRSASSRMLRSCQPWARGAK